MAEKTCPERSRGKLLTSDCLTSILFYLSILIFIIGFNFSDSPMQSGWYQQFMPDIGSRTISDIIFLDSLTGWAIASISGDTDYVIKTTNGGDNWTITYRNFLAMTGVQFLNLSTGYICGGYLYKTTDGGFNWNQVSTPAITAENLYVLNIDTIWLVWSEGTLGGIFRTTNGGVNWTQQANFGPANPDRIYMYNRNIGYANRNGGSFMYTTSNGGLNWIQVTGVDGFSDIYFIDSLTGWKAFGNMKKTTNGGINWVTQTLPFGGDIQIVSMDDFSNVNKDTIWGGGGVILQSGLRGIIYKTTNGGDNWLFQVPMTDTIMFRYLKNKFVNKLNGWCYTVSSKGVHTIIGGDTISYSTVHQVSTKVPKAFKLFDNYPNPFNPNTIIKFQIKKLADVRLVVFDVTGEEISSLVNKQIQAGEYSITFDGTNYSSGIYLYSLIVDGKLIDTKRMVLLK